MTHSSFLGWVASNKRVRGCAGSRGCNRRSWSWVRMVFDGFENAVKLSLLGFNGVHDERWQCHDLFGSKHSPHKRRSVCEPVAQALSRRSACQLMFSCGSARCCSTLAVSSRQGENFDGNFSQGKHCSSSLRFVTMYESFYFSWLGFSMLMCAAATKEGIRCFCSPDLDALPNYPLRNNHPNSSTVVIQIPVFKLFCSRNLPKMTKKNIHVSQSPGRAYN